MRIRSLWLSAAIVLIALALVAAVAIASGGQQKEKQFALLLKPTQPGFLQKPGPEETALVQEHLRHLQSLADQGVCIFAGRTLNQDVSAFGIIVVRAESEAAAQKILEDDALIRAGLVRGTVLPFQVVSTRNTAPKIASEQRGAFRGWDLRVMPFGIEALWAIL
jgi:uncharacterized protein YciI